MHERGQSDSPIVLSRSPNNAAQAVAEAAEGSGLAKGNATSKTRPGFNAGRERAKCAGSRAPSCTAGQGSAVRLAPAPR